jgi:FMN reductase
MSRLIVGFSGSLSRPSKTRALIELAASTISARFGGTAETWDLTDLQPSLGAARTLDDLNGVARDVVASILSADVLVVGSPVYKGSYTGLFKHLFDLIDPVALSGKPVLLTATGGGDKHALIIEHQLRPLFGFFEAAVLPTGVYASAGDFEDDIPASAPLIARLERAVDRLGPWLAELPAAHAA